MILMIALFINCLLWIILIPLTPSLNENAGNVFQPSQWHLPKIAIHPHPAQDKLSSLQDSFCPLTSSVEDKAFRC